MRDMVEIGMGRTARRTYELDDINIVPSRRTRSSQDVSTAWQLDAYRFEIPVLSHPTDALVSAEFAIEMGRLGGLGVLNGEGLDRQARRRGGQDRRSHRGGREGARARGGDSPSAATTFGAAGSRAARCGGGAHPRSRGDHRGPGEPAERAGADAGAGGRRASTCWSSRARSCRPNASHNDGEPLNLKTFISELDVPVVAGGVLDHRTALHLMRTGAAGVIVGYGSTSGVTTSDEVLGISVPMATAIADAAAARREYLDETGGRYVHVLADGDIHTSGDLAKAIACGADAVVLGTPLALAAEALGDGWFWPAAAAHPSLPRGALLQVALGERPSLEQVLTGPSDDPFGSLNLVGGLRRSMAKAGYCDLKEFQKVGLTVGN